MLRTIAAPRHTRAVAAPRSSVSRPVLAARAVRRAPISTALYVRAAPKPLGLLPRRTHSARPAHGVRLNAESFAQMGSFNPLILLAVAGAVTFLATNGEEAEAAEKGGKGQAAAPAGPSQEEIDAAEDAMLLLNIRDFSLEQARSWFNNYALSPNPEAILAGIRPLLRDLFTQLEAAEKSDDAPPDELQYRMMSLIGFIGGAVNRHPAQVIPRLEALMLTQNDLSEQPALLLGVMMPALVLAGNKEGGQLALQVYGLMREMEAQYNKQAKPDPKKIVAEFQKMAQNMVRGMFPVLPMICLGRYQGTGDAKVLEQAYSSLNKVLQEINTEKQAGQKLPPEAEQAAASLRNVVSTAFREFNKSSPAAAKALQDYPPAKDKYPLAHALIRSAVESKEQPKIKTPAKK